MLIVKFYLFFTLKNNIEYDGYYELFPFSVDFFRAELESDLFVCLMDIFVHILPALDYIHQLGSCSVVGQWPGGF